MGLWIVGAGGVGRETLDVALASGVLVDGFVDEHRHGEQVRALPVIAPHELPDGARIVVAVGDPVVRRRLVDELVGRSRPALPLVHPAAVVGPDTHLGEGTVVMANASISSSVRIGAHVQVQYGTTVGHDTVVDDYGTLLPGANVAGGVVIGTGATVGSGAVVLQNLRVGPGAMVGAGAVVTRVVAEGSTVVGSPARPTPGDG